MDIWTSTATFMKTSTKNITISREFVVWCVLRLMTISLVVILFWQFIMLQNDFISALKRKSSWIPNFRQGEANNLGTGEPMRGGKNIMFVELSCLFENSNSINKVMSIRETCSIESAAKMNPGSKVYLMHSCPIEFKTDDPITRLQQYPNINFWKIDMENIVSGTPLKDWNYNSVLKDSEWSTERFRDMVRFALLRKYGGLYMDLNFCVIHSLYSLKENFVVAETDDILHNNILKLQYGGPGQRLAEVCMRHLISNKSEGSDAAYNGQQTFTECFKDVCQINQLKEIDPDFCKVTVYLNHHFFPVPLEERKMLFDESRRLYIDFKTLKSVAVYLWNDESEDEKVFPESDQPYSYLAKKYCPLVYSTSGEFF